MSYLGLRKKEFQEHRSIHDGGEFCVFSEGFEYVISIRHTLGKINKQNIPIIILTDSKKMLDVITKAFHNSEKRLMIDIDASKDAYKEYEISKVFLVLSDHNMTDESTNLGQSKALREVMETGNDQNPV